MKKKTIIGIDLGGTKIQVAKIIEEEIDTLFFTSTKADGSANKVLDQIKHSIEQIMNEDIDAIGIGVPGLVDMDTGTVREVVNIPSWKKISLKTLLEKEYGVPVYVNNDANCFALGQKYFGEGKPYKNLVRLTIGTGLGAGIIIHDKLYSGKNCGAGEVGMLPYLGHNYERYCSGQFFKLVHGVSGKNAFKNAINGDEQAIKLFEEFGRHLGNALIALFYSYDPEAIILGGSISKAFPFFQSSMLESLRSYEYQHVLDTLRIIPSDHEHIAVLGAAALCYNDSSN